MTISYDFLKNSKSRFHNNVFTIKIYKRNKNNSNNDYERMKDTIIYLSKPAAKPAFDVTPWPSTGILLARAASRRSNRCSTSLRQPESNSCERLSLMIVPECRKGERRGDMGVRGRGLCAPTDILLLYYSIRLDNLNFPILINFICHELLVGFN